MKENTNVVDASKALTLTELLNTNDKIFKENQKLREEIKNLKKEIETLKKERKPS